jgi:molybdopterin-binding protein
VKRIVKGAVNAEVTLAIAPEVELVSIVTRTSAEKLGLKKGKEVFAVIKSSSVMIAAG